MRSVIAPTPEKAGRVWGEGAYTLLQDNIWLSPIEKWGKVISDIAKSGFKLLP